MKMSSSSVCQGLQSCLEPRLIEPRVLRLKLAPPGSNLSRTTSWPSKHSPSDSDSNTKQTITNTTTSTPARTKDDKNVGMGGWSFLQSLAAPNSYGNKTGDPVTEKVYVHPTVKRSSLMLNAKSLEMCTESLGSENGINSTENCDDISLFSLETSSTSFTGHAPEASRNSVSKRLNRNGSFPPPLTSITDVGGVQVRAHREDGRLILKAVATPSPRPYFEAERSNGRLRLRLFQTIVSDCDNEEVVSDYEEVVEEEGHDEEEAKIEAETFKQEICGEEDAEAERGCCREDLEENNDNAGDEMGMRKFSRPFRCNESRNRNEEILKWEPFWVAT